MKKISPAGAVLILLLLFVPRQNDDDRPSNDSSSSVKATNEPAPANPQHRILSPGESAQELQYAGSRTSEQ